MKIKWEGDDEHVTLGDPGERGLCLAEIMWEHDSFSVWILGTKRDGRYQTMTSSRRAAIVQLRWIHATIGQYVVGEVI